MGQNRVTRPVNDPPQLQQSLQLIQSYRMLDSIGSLCHRHRAASRDGLLSMCKVVHHDERLDEDHQGHDGQHDGDQREGGIAVEALDGVLGEDVKGLAL